MRKNLSNCEWHPDNGQDYSWFENPVFRDIFLRSASPDDMLNVQKEFAAGNWSVFGVWARAIMSGKVKVGFPDQSSPHSHFWSGFLLKATPQERDEFLTFLLRAQLAHSPISDRPNRGPVPGFTLSCRKALLDYLNTFEDPKHTPDPDGVVGPHIIHHSHLPDERMVHIAGQFQLVEAIPALERFLKFQRRIFQLYTDYSTGPEEVDDLFIETLRALVRIGLANPNAKDKVQQILKANHTPIAKNTKGLPKGSETIWSEIYNDGGGQGSSSRYVKTEQLTEGGGIPLKAELQRLGLKALENDGPERRDLLSGRTDKYPTFSWIVKEDQGQGIINGDRLFYTGAAVVESIDLPTGNTVFRFFSGQNNSNQGVACYYHLLSLTSAGDPLLVTQVIPLGASDGRAWWAIILDRDTGEVKRSFELAVQPERAYGPQTWPQKDDSIVFRQETKLWRQSSTGQTLWKHDIDYHASVQCANGTIAILTKTELTLASVDEFKALLVLPVTEIFKELEPSREMELREDIVLLDDRSYLFSRFDGPILAYDLKGKLLWKNKPKEGGYYLNHPRSVGAGLCGDLNNYIYKVFPDGNMCYIDKPSSMKDDYLSNDLGVFMRTDYIIHYWPYGEDKIRTPVQQFQWQAQLIALSNDYLVVNFYDNERYLACLSKAAW